MAFDFSGAISRGTNSVVNSALDSATKYVGTLTNTSVGNKIRRSVDKVLDDIGAPAAVRSVIQDINAQVVQAGVTSVTDIMTGVVYGTISGTDLKDFANLDVVQSAIKAGNPLARDILNVNALAGVARNVTTQKPTETVVDPKSSPYAVDFTDTFGPKFSFMFIVEFIFNDPYNAQEIFGQTSFSTLIYKFERPKIEIEHEEVNLYNFKTQVPKNVKYNPISFTAHDDAKANTLSTFMAYLSKLSPLFNINATNGTQFEDVGGLNFEETSNNSTFFNSSSFGTLQQGAYQETGTPFDNTKTIFREIRVYHLYDFGKYVDVYKFFNPKITNVNMDELTMTENNSNNITFEIVYDGFYIDLQRLPTDIPDFSHITPWTQYSLTNRDVASGVNIRAAQYAAQQAHLAEMRRASASQAQIDRQILLENASVIEGIDTDNDAEVEQYLRDREVGIGTNNTSSLPSLSVGNITDSVSKFWKRLF